MSSSQKLFSELTYEEKQILLDEVDILKNRVLGYIDMPLEQPVFAGCTDSNSPYFRGVPNDEYARLRSIANSLEPIPKVDWLGGFGGPLDKRPSWNKTYWDSSETAARALTKQLVRDLQSVRRCENPQSQLTCNLYALKTAERVAAAIKEGVWACETPRQTHK